MPKKTPKKLTGKQRTSREKSNSNLIMFKKGQSGNPAGGRSKEECLTSLLREEVENIDPQDKGKRTWRELIVIATMRLARKGNAAALREVWERLDGKVVDKLDINQGGDSANATLLADVLNAKELKELHDRLKRAVNA